MAKSKQKQSHPLFKINMEDFTIQKEADPIDQLHQEKTVYRASEGSYNQIAGLRSSVHSCIDPTVKPAISTQRGKEHSNSLERLFERIPHLHDQSHQGHSTGSAMPLLNLPHKQPSCLPAVHASSPDLKK